MRYVVFGVPLHLEPASEAEAIDIGEQQGCLLLLLYRCRNRFNRSKVSVTIGCLIAGKTERSHSFTFVLNPKRKQSVWPKSKGASRRMPCCFHRNLNSSEGLREGELRRLSSVGAIFLHTIERRPPQLTSRKNRSDAPVASGKNLLQC